MAGGQGGADRQVALGWDGLGYRLRKAGAGIPWEAAAGSRWQWARADYEAALGRPWDAAQRTVAKMEIGTGLPGWQAAPA